MIIFGWHHVCMSVDPQDEEVEGWQKRLPHIELGKNQIKLIELLSPDRAKKDQREIILVMNQDYRLGLVRNCCTKAENKKYGARVIS